MTDNDPKGTEDDALTEAMLRLSQADFSVRLQRSYDGGREDVLAYLVNLIAQETGRMFTELHESREVLQHGVNNLAEVLVAHAGGDFSARADRSNDGSPLDVLAFVVNNSAAEVGQLFEDRERALDDVRTARDQAQAAARAKSEFLANVSHELRTPLTLILGPLQALEGGAHGALPPAVSEQVALVRRNAARLARMVNDVLDFSRSEAGQTRARWQAVDISKLLADIAADVEPLASERGIEIATALDDTLGPVPCDRRMFEKIAINLIGNALKFTDRGGKVTVRLTADDDQVRFEVTDTGVGIAGDQLARIFDRFHQADASTTRRYEGTGLGLSLVKEFAELMHGSVSATSELGVGTTFVVLLHRSPDGVAEVVPDGLDGIEARDMQLAAIDPSRDRAVTPAVSRSDAILPRVLVAEDNADMRAYITAVLAETFEVEAAADGRAALDAVRRRIPDALVSDVMMPNMSGFELVTAIKADPALRNLPVILLTARAGSEAVSMGLDTGADDYLAKPFSPVELLARVKAAVRLHHTTRQLAATLDELQTVKRELIGVGKVSFAQRLLLDVGKRLRTTLDGAGSAQEQHDRIGAASSLARQLTELGTAGEPDTVAGFDLVDVAREAAPSGTEVLGPTALTVQGDASTVEFGLRGLLRGLRDLPYDRPPTITVRIEESDGGPLLSAVAPLSGLSLEDARRSLFPRLEGEADPLSALTASVAHVALLRNGVESSLRSDDGQLRLELRFISG